jgi:hypothetical protein
MTIVSFYVDKIFLSFRCTEVDKEPSFTPYDRETWLWVDRVLGNELWCFKEENELPSIDSYKLSTFSLNKTLDRIRFVMKKTLSL